MNYKKIETFFNKYEEGLQDVEVELDKFLYGKWKSADYEKFGFRTKIVSGLTTEHYLITEFMDQNPPFSPRLRLYYKELDNDVLDIYKIWSEDDSMAYSLDVLNVSFNVKGKKRKELIDLELEKLTREKESLIRGMKHCQNLATSLKSKIKDIDIEMNRVGNNV